MSLLMIAMVRVSAKIETAEKQHIFLNVGSFLEKGKYYTYYYKNSRIAEAVEKKVE